MGRQLAHHFAAEQQIARKGTKKATNFVVAGRTGHALRAPQLQRECDHLCTATRQDLPHHGLSRRAAVAAGEPRLHLGLVKVEGVTVVAEESVHMGQRFARKCLVGQSRQRLPHDEL